MKNSWTPILQVLYALHLARAQEMSVGQEDFQTLAGRYRVQILRYWRWQEQQFEMRWPHDPPPGIYRLAHALDGEPRVDVDEVRRCFGDQELWFYLGCKSPEHRPTFDGRFATPAGIEAWESLTEWTRLVLGTQEIRPPRARLVQVDEDIPEIPSEEKIHAIHQLICALKQIPTH